MNTQLQKITEDAGLEQQTAELIRQKFEPILEKINEWEKKVVGLVVTSVSQKSEMKVARETRLLLKDSRVEADKIRKSMKEESNRWNNAVQGVYNLIESRIKPMEAHLQAQEDFEKNLEAQRVKELNDARWAEAGENYSRYLPVNQDLGELTNQQWEDMLDKAQNDYFDEVEAELARKAADEAQAKENERLRKENEQIKAAETVKTKRIQALTNLGLAYDGESFNYGNEWIMYSGLAFRATDVEFLDIIEQVKIPINRIRSEQEKQAEADRQFRAARIKRITDLGFIFSGYSFDYKGIEEYAEDLLTTPDFEKQIKILQKLKDEADQEEIKQQKLEQERKQSKLSDEQKLREYIAALLAVPVPQMTDEICNGVVESIINEIKSH